jgi:hypothetical protein
MKIIDVTVLLDSNLSVCPGNTTFSLEPLTRIAKSGSSNVSTLQPSARGGTTDIEDRAPLRIVGAERTPPRFMPHKS